MKLGFVGLGRMGAPVVRRLLAAGHQVTGHNRTEGRAAALRGEGMAWAATAREAAAAGDVVFSMVTDADALRSVCEGPDGILAGLHPGSLLADLSTVGPQAILRLAAAVRERGAVLLDAPVSGSPATIAQGRLAFMVGGEPEDVARLRPLLEDIGQVVTHVGGTGQAALVKLALNLSVAVQVMVLAEGVALAEKGGVPRAKTLEVMLASGIASPALQYRGPFLLGRPAEAWFDVRMMQKDLQLALDEGRRLGVPLPTSGVTSQVLVAAEGLGLGAEDFAALFSVLARLTGLEDPR